VVEKCMAKATFIAKPSLSEYIESDKETRVKAEVFCSA